MTYSPDFGHFSTLCHGVHFVPVYRQLAADTLTPVTALKRLGPSNTAFLFESVIGGERVGRFSFLGVRPFQVFTATRQHITITGPDRHETRTAENPLAVLEAEVLSFRSALLPAVPRFCGAAVGYAGYDMVRYVEQLPHAPTDDRNLPDLWFGFYDEMLVFDNARKTVLVVALARVDNQPPQAAYDDACRRVDAMVDRLRQPTDGLTPLDIAEGGPLRSSFQSNFTQAQFEAAVDKCQEYIRAGDIFQVVIGQRFERTTTATAFEIYRALRIINPSPFMFYLETPTCTLVGSSPEIMVRVEDRDVTIRPLAGTRRRGRDPQEDLALERELLADEKELAEHIMLVDLARNDVGRVAEYGSITVADVMKVERYSHVMHITSDVSGKLAAGKTALDALRAGLPAGTVSGAPKVRAMEIIDEIEPTRRGPYGGAVGYLDFAGNMDTCIALRTLVMMGQQAYVQAGAGIVADSVPTSEYEETLSKARGLLKAIEVAEEMHG